MLWGKKTCYSHSKLNIKRTLHNLFSTQSNLVLLSLIRNILKAKGLYMRNKIERQNFIVKFYLNQSYWLHLTFLLSILIHSFSYYKICIILNYCLCVCDIHTKLSLINTLEIIQTHKKLLFGQVATSRGYRLNAATLPHNFCCSCLIHFLETAF